MLDASGIAPDLGDPFLHRHGPNSLGEDSPDDATDAGFGEARDLLASQLSSMTLAEVRLLRNELKDLESRISYWRRIIQARLDLLNDGAMKRGATVEGLNRVLSQHLGRPNRIAMLTTEGDGDLPPLEGLARLWNRGITAVSEDSELLIEDLETAEHELSARRSELFSRIDAATAELVHRYREDPLLALSALPSRSERPPPL